MPCLAAVLASRRTAARRRLAGEPLENRLLLSVDSWVLPTGLPAATWGHREVDADSAGNLYVAANVDGGAGNATDIFLAKYSPSGEELWRHHFPYPGEQYCFGAAVTAGGFYVVGGFDGIVDFDPTDEGEAILQHSTGYLDGFLAKYSLDGALLWVRQFENEWSRLHGVTVQQDEVYVTGAWTIQLPSGQSETHAMVAKVSNNNDLMWVKDYGMGTATGLAVYKPADGLTRIFVGGNGGGKDAERYVASMVESPDGTGATVDWVKNFADDFGWVAPRIAVGTDVVDEINGVLAPRLYVPSYTGKLLKLDQAGNVLWSQQATSELIYCRDVAVYDDVIYLVGHFRGTASFSETGSDATVVSRGDFDSFLVRYSSNSGHFVGVQRMGGRGEDYLTGLAVVDGWVFATGVASPDHADFPASQPGQLSAFVPVMTNEFYVMRLDAAAPVVNIAEPTITVREGEPVTLSATTSAGTIEWYESSTVLGAGSTFTVTLDVGTHLISAIATDEGRIGMAGVVVNVINTETYTSTDTPKQMADAHPSKGAGLTMSQISVSSNTSITAIGTLTVGLNISHSAPSQLQAVLVGPDGTQETLFDRPSSLQATYETTAFVGKSLAGTWTLRLYDHVRGTVGTLNSWSITASPMVMENRSPEANNDSYTTPFATLLEVPAPGVLGNDTDPDDDPLTVEVVEGPASGELVWSGDGSFTFAPVADFEGTVTFTYVAFDSAGLQSNVATVTITVAPPLGSELTFDSTDVPKTIVDPHPVQGARDTISQLVVANTSASIGSEFRLNLSISHASPAQLSAKLRSPVGTEAVVFPQGTASIPTEWTTNAFAGQPLDGTWQLILRDNVRGTTGTLNAWSITVAPVRVVPPCRRSTRVRANRPRCWRVP